MLSVNVVADVVPAIVLNGPVGDNELYIVYDVAPGDPVHDNITLLAGEKVAVRPVGAGGGDPPGLKLYDEILLKLESVTYTFPAGSVATSTGLLNCPGLKLDSAVKEPKTVMKFPLLSNF